MAEVFGVASGALSIAGFAGQLAQSAVFLHDFIKDIKDAPRTAQHISEELRILTITLRELRKSYNISDAGLQNSLEHCQKRLDALLDIIKNIDPAQYTQKRRRLWRQCRVALKRSDLVKYLADLNRSKLMLIQACDNVSRAEQISQTNLVTSILQHTHDLTAKQNLSVAATGVVQTTVQEIKLISSGLQSSTTGLAAIAQDTKAKLDSTGTKVSRIHDNTDQIRVLAERIESAQQVLVNNTLRNQGVGLDSLRKEMDRALDRGLKQHLKEHFETTSLQHGTRPQVLNDTSNRQRSTSGRMADTEPLRYHSHGRDFDCSIPVSEQSTGSWIKNSSTESQQILTNNRVLGTTYIRTITVTYTRQNDKGQAETKQISTMILSYLPPLWLTTRGAILRRQQLLTNCAGNQSIPHWTLSTVNVISWDAPIIRACVEHDLDEMRRLFDLGLASPYDVDPEGTNLIGLAASGTHFRIFQSRHGNLRARLHDLNSILDLLLEYDVDAGDVNVENFNAITFMVFGWDEASAGFPFLSTEVDYMDYLLNKLLKRAKTDPFSCNEALLAVAPYKGPVLYKFPGFIWYGISDHSILPRQLDLLIGQTEWPLAWDHEQLDLLSSAIHLPFMIKSISGIWNYVAFWVTSQPEDVKEYLYTKFGLMKNLLDHKLLDLAAKHSVVQALNSAIHGGGEAIAILVGHLRCNCFPGRKPWIRHQFKKLVLVERWLTELFCLLLTRGSTHVTNSMVLDELYQHARKHNARTLGAWTKALKACAQNRARDGGVAESISQSPENATSAEYETSNETSPESEWETEHSESDHDSQWETEEDLDDGQLFEPARDKHCTDATNPDLKSKSRHTRDAALYDYDEEYWSH